MNEGCLACDLITGRHELPGGIIYKAKYWIVEHTIGPLPVGTLIIKPLRHVLTFPDLTEEEVAEYGPLLYKVSGVIKNLAKADQIYICLWSHHDYAKGESFIPGHIHVIVQPAWNNQRKQFKRSGPYMQTDMFDQEVMPGKEDIEKFAEAARKRIRF